MVPKVALRIGSTTSFQPTSTRRIATVRHLAPKSWARSRGPDLLARLPGRAMRWCEAISPATPAVSGWFMQLLRSRRYNSQARSSLCLAHGSSMGYTDRNRGGGGG